jgi:hypothetical protein
VRAAIDLALSQSRARAATKAYQHLADPLEHAGDYRRARATYVEATRFCRANDASATADFCLACRIWARQRLHLLGSGVRTGACPFIPYQVCIQRSGGDCLAI